MKTKKLFKIYNACWEFLTVIVSGCITSVHPLFTEKDYIFRPELLGSWQNGNETLVFSSADSTYYSVLNIDKKDTTKLVGHLGKLGGHYYLDMTINDDDKRINDLVGIYLFPVHVFFKVSLKNDQLVMNSFAFSSEWLEKLIKEKRIRIKHEVENKQVLLTASTEDLQKFVTKYSDEQKAFDDTPTQYKRITTK